MSARPIRGSPARSPADRRSASPWLPRHRLSSNSVGAPSILPFPKGARGRDDHPPTPSVDRPPPPLHRPRFRWPSRMTSDFAAPSLVPFGMGIGSGICVLLLAHLYYQQHTILTPSSLLCPTVVCSGPNWDVSPIRPVGVWVHRPTINNVQGRLVGGYTLTEE